MRALVVLPVLLVLILLAARTIASYVIEYRWWQEMNQVPTWIDLMLYGFAPLAAATVVAFVVLFGAHGRGMKYAGIGLWENSSYAMISTAVLLFLAFILAAAVIDTWTVVRFFGGRNLPSEATAWRDAVFGLPLKFYLFELPFYAALRSFVLVLSIAAVVVYWFTARGWQLRGRVAEFSQHDQLDIRILSLPGALRSRFVRIAAAAFLLAWGLRFFLGRYEMVWNDHGFMVGVDYVDRVVTLPLQWVVISACLVAAGLVTVGRWKLASWMALALVIRMGGPAAVLGNLRTS